MKTIEEHINFINTKLQMLLKKHAALQKENEGYVREIERLKEKEKDLLQKLDSLEIQNSILKTSAGTLVDKQKRDFEKRINQYIKDLDKCMAMLNT